MRLDAAGNIFSQARKVKWRTSEFTVQDRVGGDDSLDLYRIKIKHRSRLNLYLTSSQGTVATELVNDLNGNGKIDVGEVIPFTTSGTKTAQSMTRQELSPGVYFLKVSSTPRSAITYEFRLTISVSPEVTPTIPSMTLVPMTDPPMTDPMISEVFRLTNDIRTQNGLPPLTYNTTLGTVAQTYSQTMASLDFFDHVGLDGSTPQSRSSSQGYTGAVGENIAAGYTSAADVVQAWINSPGHRANLLNPYYTEIGIGYYYLANDTGMLNYHHYWAQNFGTPWS